MTETSVTIVDWDGQNRSEFKEIALEVLASLSKEIYMRVPHKRMSEVRSDGRFHINIWSTMFIPGKSPKFVRPPDQIYGIPVDCHDEAFLPSGNERSTHTFCCEYTGYAVAELIENNLFIHHDLCHHGSSREIQIFKKLLEDVVQWMSGDDEDPDKREVRIQKELEVLRSEGSRAKNKFVDLFSAVYAEDARALQVTLENETTALNTLHSELITAVKENEAMCTVIEQYSAGGPGSVGIFEKEFDKLINIPHVLGVDVVDDMIHVFTDMISVIEDEQRYRIGKFRIEVPAMPHKREKLRFINLTNNGRGPGVTKPRGFDANDSFNRHHPHVGESGQACLGNIGNAIDDYIRMQQYSVVIILAIKFLESVNVEDSAGRGIKWWPKG